MKKLLIITLFVVATALSAVPAFGTDYVLYDEPHLDGYIYIGHKAPPAHGTIETNAFPADTNGNSLCYSGVACIVGVNTGGDTANPPNSCKVSFFLPNFGWFDPTHFVSLTYYVIQGNQAAGRANWHAYGGVDSGQEVGTKVRVGFTAPLDVYGLNTLNFGASATWQAITMPISAWAFAPGTLVNRFTMDVVNTNSNFKNDLVVLHGDRSGQDVIYYPSCYPPATPTPTP